MHTPITESQVELQINQRLENLNWKLDPAEPHCNVAKQNVKTPQEKKALSGKIPDYVLYDSSNKPLIIIEAKRPGIDIKQARAQGIAYAKRLKAPIVFATNGSYTTSWHVKHERPLELNKNELNDFISQAIAIHYRDQYAHFTEDEKVIKDKEELIPIFKKLNDHFYEAGIPAGRPRIELFCNFLFLKLISELSVQKDSIIRAVPISKTWGAFTKKYHGQALYEFINDTAYAYFKEAYGGEVLSRIKINANKYEVLDKIVESLDGLILNPIRTDIKGDAFEFFLRNYGGADTDFGEYFTPRHIVEAMVAILNPQIGEKVYDPFCGTGGMLTYSYRHIHDSMAKTPKNIATLKQETVYGGELTDMSRVAKMNMILAGDGHSNILQQDSYATPQRGKYDVVITNMPFGSKMKTPYARFYNYHTEKAEIVGILHCLDALSDNPNARAGILVPEGILFNRTKAYKELRRALTETYSLENIISLPSGLFGKNTGVKSNILIIKKHPQPQKKHIWHFHVQNDGFTLDAHRRKLKGPNDIDTISSETDLRIQDSPRLKKLGFSLLYKAQIKAQDHILLPGHYQDFQLTTQYKMVKLGELINFLPKPKRRASYGKEKGLYPFFTSSSIQNKYVDIPDYNEECLIIGDGGLSSLHIHDQFSASDHNFILQANLEKALNKYLYFVLKGNFALITKGLQGATLKNVSKAHLQAIQIPLPSLEEQKRMVEELESYQVIIHSAQKIIDSWKPFIQLKGVWEEKTISDVINFCKRGKTPMYGNGDIQVIKSGQIRGFYSLDLDKSFYLKDGTNIKDRLLVKKDILINSTGVGTAGRIGIFDKEGLYTVDSHVTILRVNEKIISEYLMYFLIFQYGFKGIEAMAKGSSGQIELSLSTIKDIKIKLPPLEEQQKIVAELEAERAMIEYQKQVITTFEAKMQKRLDALWHQ